MQGKFNRFYFVYGTKSPQKSFEVTSSFIINDRLLVHLAIVLLPCRHWGQCKDPGDGCPSSAPLSAQPPVFMHPQNSQHHRWGGQKRWAFVSNRPRSILTFCSTVKLFFLFSPLCLHSSLLVLSLWICALFCIVEDFIFWIRMSEESNSNAFVSQAISDRHHVLPVLLAISELSCHNCEAIFWGLRPCTAAVPESIHYL